MEGQRFPLSFFFCPMSKLPVRVHIFNQSYSLLSDGDPNEVLEIANRVDELMASIAGKISSGDSTRVAVLACMHMADQLRTVENRLKKYEQKSERIATLLEEALEKA